MSDCMMFPKDWEKFIEDYSFEDKEEVYTNGSMLIPVFRVEQMIEHYFGRGWIPVTERLPEKTVDVLLYFGSKYGNQSVGFWHGCKECDAVYWCAYTDDGFYTDCDYKPTHWMPLPEPPKEG